MAAKSNVSNNVPIKGRFFLFKMGIFFREVGKCLYFYNVWQPYMIGRKELHF